MARRSKDRRNAAGTVGLITGAAIGVVLLYPLAKALIPLLIVTLVLTLLIRAIKR
jgi:hypothetical protein